MNRLFALTIGVLVAVIAAWAMVSSFFASSRNIDTSRAVVADDIPIALKQRVDCMYQELTRTPGVRQPRQGLVTSKGSL